MDYEPNVNSGSSKVILGIEKKLMAFDVDPNILKTGLNNYLIQNSILLSKSNIRDSVIIKEIISKVDQLSNNLMKVVEDIKEKFDAIEDALYKYSEYNENNINSTNVKINSLNEYNENFKKDQMNLINTFQNNYLTFIKGINEDVQKLKTKLQENENKFNNIDNLMKEKIDFFLKERIENMIKNKEIKVDIINNENKKEFEDIKIEKYATNTNNKELKFKIFQKNNSIIFKDITTDCDADDKEKALVEKCKIIFKKDEKIEKGITYAISTLSKDWDFSRHMKNILKRIYRSRYYRRINTYNLNHVFRMKWSKNQIQFEKIQATTRFKNYNNKNNNQNLSGKLSNQNNNKNINNSNNGKNQRNVNNNKTFNKRRIIKLFKKKFNKNRFYNRKKYFNNQRIVLVPRMMNYGPMGQNF